MPPSAPYLSLQTWLHARPLRPAKAGILRAQDGIQIIIMVIILPSHSLDLRVERCQCWGHKETIGYLCSICRRMGAARHVRRPQRGHLLAYTTSKPPGWTFQGGLQGLWGPSPPGLGVSLLPFPFLALSNILLPSLHLLSLHVGLSPLRSELRAVNRQDQAPVFLSLPVPGPQETLLTKSLNQLERTAVLSSVTPCHTASVWRNDTWACGRLLPQGP